MISLHGADKPIPDERFTESTVHTTEDKLWLPIHYPPPPGSGVSKGQTIGVLRALNHISTVRGQAQAFQFSWEEFSLLGFLAEVIGIIAFQYHRVSKQPEILERLLHGVQAQALATIQELNQLQERANISKLIPDTFKYNIPNALANLEVLLWQLEKYRHAEIPLSFVSAKVPLYGDVLANTVAFAAELAWSYGTTLHTTTLSEAGFNDIPYVKGDVNALRLVFKNLFDNALKYRKPRQHCKIDLTYSTDASYVYVQVTDHGVGFAEDEEEWIFAEGFRGDYAISADTTGTGVGLAQSLDAMQQMGGDLIVRSCQHPTCFIVKIPRLEVRP